MTAPPSRAPAKAGVDAGSRADVTDRSLLEAVLDALPVGMAITDADGGSLHVNAEYDRIWGGPRPTVASVDDYEPFKAWWADTGEPVKSEEWASAVAVREDRTVTGQVLEIQRFDGSRAVVINAASPVHDAHGRVVGSAVAIQEITALRRAQDALRDSEDRYRALSENFRVALKASPVTLATLDRELRYTWVHNPRHGFSVEGIVGLRPDELISAQHTSELMDLLRHVLDNGCAEQREISGRTKDGAHRWDYLATVEPLRDDVGACVGLTLAIIDISARKLMEDELRERDRRRTEFLAVLSHELRNPLAPIRSALQVMKRVAPGGPEAIQAQGVIERQVDQLVRLVDDLLDVTRVTTNKIRLQRTPVDVVGLTARTTEDLRPLFMAKGVRLDVVLAPGPAVVEGDATRLAQVIGNLLHNAAKFTPPGGTTTVTLAVDADAGQAHISVSDTGVGIDQDEMSRLFQPFMQAGAVVGSPHSGLGLGLALVRMLVELHGGDVNASSAGHGHGATFVVRLPLHADGPPVSPRAPSVASCARRVLVIDDNLDGAESLRMLLELNGHEVRAAHDGPGGLALARVFLPEVVICDLGLPGMDGFEVARAIRRDDTMVPPFLIALSGYALPNDVRRSLEAGFDQHLPKPPDMDRLFALIHSLRR